MQLCWDTKSTPSEWHVSKVVPVFKKGSPAECDNYRPISLVSVLYKLYASILLRRLKAAGAEGRLWQTQFGFRSKRSTEDALFIVRRRLDQALAAKGGRVFLLALDWKKAFDAISPQRLLEALRRFGLNEDMLQAVGEIYSNRAFIVVDGGKESTQRPQRSGISQGCPLSPFLFGMVMTVLIQDARSMLSDGAKHACTKGELEEVLFADDTLLISCSGSHLQEYMAAVEKCGADYGLQIHWGKVHLVPVGSEQDIHGPAGQEIPPQESMVYLGSSIHAGGKSSSEVARKIGCATAEFNSLEVVWKRSSMSTRRKLQLLDACILSKLRYGIASAWLLKADLRRLDGFHARCLRKILGIKPAFVSRVSNDRVRQIAGQEPFSEKIRAMQRKLFEAVLTDPNKQVLRDVTFEQGTSIPLTNRYVRKRGRPKQNWADEMVRLR